MGQNVFQTLRRKLDRGELTMIEARVNLYSLGWFDYLPSEEQTRRMIDKFG